MTTEHLWPSESMNLIAWIVATWEDGLLHDCDCAWFAFLDDDGNQKEKRMPSVSMEAQITAAFAKEAGDDWTAMEVMVRKYRAKQTV